MHHATAEELELIQHEAVEITRQLIRIDTSNYGDGSGPGETAAAQLVVELLTDVGLEPEVVESQPGRPSVIVRIAGRDHDRGGLLIHGHLDVVPAEAKDWSVDPFAAEIREGMIWGRGAVDMKDMDGMILAVVRHLARTGTRPPRDLVIAMLADEEAGGVWGSHWLVDNRPDLFAGCTEAISEVGGYSITVPEAGRDEGRRVYLLQTAEKGLAWIRLRATGRAGHGSVPNRENAITRLAEALVRLDEHDFGTDLVEPLRVLFTRIGDIHGTPFTGENIEQILPLTGGAKQFISAALGDGANATTVKAGYKGNVIPQTAEATVDCRFLPGHEEKMLNTIREIAGEHVEVIVDLIGEAVEAPLDTDFTAAMSRAITAEDPEAELQPYCLSAGTDNKAFSRLGIHGYGFAPLQLPADLEFAPLFHGIDERVPVDAVRFGARVLLRLVHDC